MYLGSNQKAENLRFGMYMMVCLQDLRVLLACTQFARPNASESITPA